MQRLVVLMTLCLTSERDSLSRNKELKILVTEYTTPVHYFRAITIGISSDTTHMAVFCVLLSCGGYSEKRTGGKICSGPLSEVEHCGLC